MIIFFSAVFILGFISVIILCSFFKYSIELGLYHMISLGFLCAIAVAMTLLIKSIFTNPRIAYIITNTLALFFWISICLFYPVVLGSNHFWGNTITFDILKNYLTSFNSILNILPVEKWILISILTIYFLAAITIFYFIRIRISFFIDNKVFFKRIPRKYLRISLLILIVVIFLSRNSIIDLKRTMHFKQEPVLYFIFGPMWDVHSDELLLSTHKNSEARCIDSIQKSPDKNKIAVVILLDALRSDHLPMYGYERNTAPFLDSLYKNHRLTRIKNSFSTSTNTIGGISGLFYSKDWDNFSYSQLNLMQYFQLSGYSTSAFLTGYHSGWYGLSAMYRNYCDNFYESTSAYHTAIDDDLVTLKKIESKPFTSGSFVFIHLLSTHTIGKRNNQFKHFVPDKVGINTGYKEALSNNYDNGIVQGDYVIRQVFDKLKKENLLSNATIFIVGDHGDLIGEDGLYGHAGGLHEKLLEVPILLYDDSSSWYKESVIASLKDIAPTITDRIFNKIPTCWQGRSLGMKQPSEYFLPVSASSVKTNLSQGYIHFDNDTLRLKIFNKKGELQRESLKIDSIHWKTIYTKQ